MVTRKSDDAPPARQSAITLYVKHVDQSAGATFYTLRSGITVEQRAAVLAELRAQYVGVRFSVIGSEIGIFPDYLP